MTRSEREKAYNDLLTTIATHRREELDRVMRELALGDLYFLLTTARWSASAKPPESNTHQINILAE